MGRRKPFIDKKSATTYSLLYNDADETGDDEAPGRASRDAGPATSKSDHRAIIAELQGWQDEASVVQISEERRREIVDFGFPDDGYDYLKHLKGSTDDSQGLKDDLSSSEQAPSGPMMYLPAPFVEPPPEDVKVIDARRLPPQQPATDEEAVFGTLREVSAFSRDVEDQQIRGAAEIEALNQMMRELEQRDGDDGAEGYGDLLDDFVSSALVKAPGHRAPSRRLATVPESESEDVEKAYVLDDSASSLSDSSHAGLHGDESAPQSRGHTGSIASTYWRPERRDRTELSSVLDDRYEQLALDYDSDELGDLDEPDGGGASITDFHDILTECLAEQQSSQYQNAGSSQAPGSTAASRPALPPSKQDNVPHTAVAKARELVMSGALRENEDAGMVDDPHPAACNWDCETVLSNYSNIDNHPGLLSEPGSRASLSRRSRRAQAEMAAAVTDQQNTSVPPATASSQAPHSMQRSKDENPEERRERKRLVKEARREARVRKKETKIIYKESASIIKADPMYKQRVIVA